jgi:hypothetical protein
MQLENIFVVVKKSEIIYEEKDSCSWLKSPLTVKETYEQERYPVFFSDGILYRRTCIDNIPVDAIAVLPCLEVQIVDKSGESNGYVEYIREAINLESAINYSDWMISCYEEEVADGEEIKKGERDEFDFGTPPRTFYRYVSLTSILEAGVRALRRF